MSATSCSEEGTRTMRTTTTTHVILSFRSALSLSLPPPLMLIPHSFLSVVMDDVRVVYWLFVCFAPVGMSWMLWLMLSYNLNGLIDDIVWVNCFFPFFFSSEMFLFFHRFWCFFNFFFDISYFLLISSHSHFLFYFFFFFFFQYEVHSKSATKSHPIPHLSLLPTISDPLFPVPHRSSPVDRRTPTQLILSENDNLHIQPHPCSFSFSPEFLVHIKSSLLFVTTANLSHLVVASFSLSLSLLFPYFLLILLIFIFFLSLFSFFYI